VLGKPMEREYSMAELLKRPGVRFDAVTALRDASGAPELVSRETLHADLGPELADAVIEQLEIGIKYAGYIDKQIEDVERARAFEDLHIPAGFDYSKVTALGFEVRQKLMQGRPATVGQASRISGVTPAAISLLLIYLRKRRFGDGVSDSPLAA
jgi:tRNA uridine 5-carboxymethylaminomethyl modification enzyme